ATLKLDIVIQSIYLYMQCIKQTYTLTIEKVSFFKEEGPTIVDGSNIFLMGRERLINGTVDVYEDLDPEHFTTHIGLYSDTSGNGEFRPFLYNVSTLDPCTTLKEYGSYAKPSLQPGTNTNFPIDGDVCPIPKDTYYFRDIEVQTDNLPSQVPRGFLKGVLTIFKDNQTICVFELLARVEDKYL
ncbi:hypothetical protein KR093_011781, partial [Drosophila rubida]